MNAEHERSAPVERYAVPGRDGVADRALERALEHARAMTPA